MDITLWLQNDLGLTHMNETHLRGLVYHPRHGSLCRRFVSLLKDSTLLTKKNPGLTATDDLNHLKAKFKEKSDKLETIKSDLSRLVSEREEEELKIINLDKQMQIERNSNEVLTLALSILEVMSGRPKSYLSYKKNLDGLKDALSGIDDNIYVQNKKVVHQENVDIQKSVKQAEALINIVSNLLNELSASDSSPLN